MIKSEIQQIGILKQYDAETASHLRDMLFGDKLEKREKWFKLFEDPIFATKYRFKDLDEEREIAFKRL